MADDAKITITISVDLLLPVPEESLESYLYYLEKLVPDEEKGLPASLGEPFRNLT